MDFERFLEQLSHEGLNTSYPYPSNEGQHSNNHLVDNTGGIPESGPSAISQPFGMAPTSISVS
jgi:hypothetical protein